MADSEFHSLNQELHLTYMQKHPKFQSLRLRHKLGQFLGLAKNWFGKVTIKGLSSFSLGIASVIYVFIKVTHPPVIVDPFGVPKSYEEAGLTSQVMADRVGSAMQEIERSTHTSVKRDVCLLEAREEPILEIQIPGTKVGLKTVIEILRDITGNHSNHIGGNVVYRIKENADDKSDSATKGRVTLTVFLIRQQNQIGPSNDCCN
jgi:hypothetical protein